MAYLDSDPGFDLPAQRRGRESPAWVFILEAIHHGNEHRTQAGTVLLSHRLEAPEIDVWSDGWAEGLLQPLP